MEVSYHAASYGEVMPLHLPASRRQCFLQSFGLQLFKNVCERGRWSSMFELAYKQHKSGRVDSSLATYMMLAELGYEVAQSNVAYILDQGKRKMQK